MKLVIKQDEFENKIKNFIKLGNEIKEKHNSQITKDEYNIVKQKGDNWISEVKDFLKKSFDIKENIFVIGFSKSVPISYMIQNIEPDYNQYIRQYFEEIHMKIDLLEYYMRLIRIADAVTNPNSEKVLNRSSFSIQQKLDLILEKLYDLGGDRHHYIDLIFELNGIKLSHRGEDREFAKTLEQNGYIDTIKAKDILVKINMKGRIYIEGKRVIKKEDYNTISSDYIEITKKVDEIITHLTKLGFGQEIIFEEIEELKDLYTKLNKKNWGQVLKGKLIDLSLSKLVENETIAYIYEKLTDSNLKLP